MVGNAGPRFDAHFAQDPGDARGRVDLAVAEPVLMEPAAYSTTCGQPRRQAIELSG
jgi:hypothetical protein